MRLNQILHITHPKKGSNVPVKRDCGFHSNTPNFYPNDSRYPVQLYAKVSSYRNLSFQRTFFYSVFTTILPNCSGHFLGQESIKFSNNSMSIFKHLVFILSSRQMRPHLKDGPSPNSNVNTISPNALRSKARNNVESYNRFKFLHSNAG